MKFTERTKLTNEQKQQVAIELLEKVDYYGLNPELFVQTPSFKKALSTANDQFEILRDIPGALIRIAREIENMENPAEGNPAPETKTSVNGMTIMQIAIADANDLTVGEFLLKTIDEFKKVGFMDAKINKILCEDGADEMLTIAMCQNPNGVNATLQYEEMNPLLAYYDKLTGQTSAEAKEVKEQDLTGLPIELVALINDIYAKKAKKDQEKKKEKIRINGDLSFMTPELLADFIRMISSQR